MIVPALPEALIDQLADVIGNHLSHKQVGDILPNHGISVPGLEAGSRVNRVRAALKADQRQYRCANHILAMVKDIAAPVRFVGNASGHRDLLDKLNTLLSFNGMKVRDDGEISETPPAKTISEAEERASTLRKALMQRGVHPDVLDYCRAELLQNNYFHAVLEASKSVFEKIRQRTGLVCDGENLIGAAFSIQSPMLALNNLQTDSEQSEQKGFANLLRGVFGTFRNPTAHAPKVNWIVSDIDALDLLTLVSYLHRRIDAAVDVPR